MQSVRRLLIVGGIVATLFAAGGGLWLSKTQGRPLDPYRRWQSGRFYAQGLRAESAGDQAAAQSAYLAAIDYWPAAREPKIRLALRLAAQERLEEALGMAAQAGLDARVFVHDALLSEGRASALVRLACQGVRDEPRRRGSWLATLRFALPMGGAEARRVLAEELAAATWAPDARDWAEAVACASDGDGAGVWARLRQRQSAGGVDAGLTLVGLELLLQTGKEGEAWVWLNRQRGLLGDFDARWAEFRLERVREAGSEPQLARRFAGLKLTVDRWIRLARAVGEEGRGDALRELEALAAGLDEGRAAEVCATMWALWMSAGDEEEAVSWNTRYRQVTGYDLPLLVGRGLQDAEVKRRVHAVCLLAREAPLARELIQVLMQPKRAAGDGAEEAVSRGF